MKFAAIISFLVATGLAAPVEPDLERTNKSPFEEDTIPVAVLLVVPEQPAFRGEGDETMKLSPESALPLPVSDERAAKNYAYETQGPYVNTAAAYKPVKPAGSGVMATFTAAVNPSAIPILLSCAPNVVAGKLVEAKPVGAYRSVFSDLTDIFSQDSSSDDVDLSEVLGLDSPASIIPPEGDDERKKRYVLIEGGATRYKVSEDYPETRQGNHHLVSEDYPRPNMVKLSLRQI